MFNFFSFYARYGDAPWISAHPNQVSYGGGIRGLLASNGARPGPPYSSTFERIFGGTDRKKSPNFDFHRHNPFHLPGQEHLQFPQSVGSWQTLIKTSSNEPTMTTLLTQHQPQSADKTNIAAKRKVSDSDCEVDLNLTLRTRPKHDEDDQLKKGLMEDHHEEVDSSLSLSLFSSSSSSKHARRRSGDLDLTLWMKTNWSQVRFWGTFVLNPNKKKKEDKNLNKKKQEKIHKSLSCTRHMDLATPAAFVV